MIYVDTGYFLATLDPDDGLHEIASAWARAISEPVLTTEYVLWEVINTLSASVERYKAVLAMDMVQQSNLMTYLPASVYLFNAGWSLFRQRSDKDWSLTDCISFQVMHERGISRALAYDRDFLQAGFEPLLRRLP